MCITEIWTYRECGCSHDRDLPCAAVRATRDDTAIVPLDSVATSSDQDSNHSTTVKDFKDFKDCGEPLVDVSNGSVDSCHQYHGSGHVIHRQFLESICDSCLLKEINFGAWPTSKTINSSHAVVETPNSTILSSEVSVEIDGQKLPNSRAQWRLWPTENHYNNFNGSRSTKAVSSSASSLASSVNLKHGKVTCIPAKTERQSLQFDNDADDEGTLGAALSSNSSDTSHGHFRSHSKQERRKAIDLSREDLRISSRWSSGERESMEQFRDALKEAAIDKTESTFSRFVKKRTESPSKKLRSVKSFMTGLKKSISYTSLPGGTYRSGDTSSYNGLEHTTVKHLSPDDIRLTSRQIAFRDHYYPGNDPKNEADNPVRETRTLHNGNTTDGRMYEKANDDIDTLRQFRQEDDDLTSSTSSKTSSWEKHLQLDLTRKSRRKKPISLADDVGKEVRIPYHLQLPEFTTLDVCFEAGNELPDDSHWSNGNFAVKNAARHVIHDDQEYWRLPSSAYRNSTTDGSTQSSATHPLLSERIGDVVSSSEFTEPQTNNTIDVLVSQDESIM